MRGRIAANWGFYFNYRDNIEIRDNLDRRKFFTPATGVQVFKNEEDLIDLFLRILVKLGVREDILNFLCAN